MYYISQQQSGGYDLVLRYYKTEKGFIKDLKNFLEAWVHIECIKHSDSDESDHSDSNSDEDEEKENYNIEDVIKNMWETTDIVVEDEDGTNWLEWGKIHFED